MHELSIARSVVERAGEVAREHGAARVVAVRVRVGELSGVVAGALLFAFEAARAGTLAEAARLDVEEVPARARCTSCRAGFSLGSPPSLCCPACARPAADVVSGRELEIAAVELAEPQDVLEGAS